MKTVLLLLLFIGAFLVMDGAHREAMKTAVRDAKARYRGKTRYTAADADDILDLQFGTRSDQFGSIFDSSGPWAYRGAPTGAEPILPLGITIDAARSDKSSYEKTPVSQSPAPPKATPIVDPANDNVSAAMRAGGPGPLSKQKVVEGFSGVGGGKASFIDAFGDPSRTGTMFA